MFHESPTSANIISAFRKLTSETCSGDCAFFHYSGEFTCDEVATCALPSSPLLTFWCGRTSFQSRTWWPPSG
jgi:hypothetical protein